MARPKRVYPERLPQYTHMHTIKQKMMAGTSITILYFLKTTALYFMSMEVWAFCASKFKSKIKNAKLEVNLPTLTDEKAVEFLKEHAWHDWVNRAIKDNDTQILEALQCLSKLFPDKKKIFFYELKSLVSAFCHGSFIRYDKEGNVEAPREYDIEQRQYYIRKYIYHLLEVPHIKSLYEAYQKTPAKPEKDKTAAYKRYADAEKKYLYEHHDLTPVFVSIGENIICCPYVFTHATVKKTQYEHAGEIYMVVTPDTVYFEIERHF